MMFFVNRFHKQVREKSNNKPAIAYIVELYKLGVGSIVPSGTTSINFDIVTVLAEISCSKFSIPVPNFSKKMFGSTFTARSLIADSSELLRK